MLRALLLGSVWAGMAAANLTSLLYIPLDERFTTRDAFLNLAALTGEVFNVSTPDTSIISLQRTPANLPAMDAWVASQMPVADASIISLELYLYGGLIASRCSNDSTASIVSRVDQLVDYAKKYPGNTVLLGTVVMRIPAYNTVPPTEDPWYWAVYGMDLFTYSFYLSKFNHTHNASDYATAMAAAAQVPPAILDEFVWRRQRNFNVTLHLLEQYAVSVAAGTPLFRSLFITLDDNAQYGFNIDESVALRQVVQQLGLGQYVLIYPGADEVGLTMLSRLVVDTVGASDEDGGPAAPVLQLVFRRSDNASLQLIPNFEGQPMLHTLMDHIAASGATAAYSQALEDALALAQPAHGSSGVGVRPWRGDTVAWPVVPLAHYQPQRAAREDATLPTAVLLVDNFGTDEYPQVEAPDQPVGGRSPRDYAMFTPYVCGGPGAGGGPTTNVVAFASNRYSNGADVVLVQYLLDLAGNASCAAPPPTTNARGLGLDRAAFSGWNTDGNSVGTAVANLVLLAYFADFGPYQRARGHRLQRIATYASQKRAARAAHGSSVEEAPVDASAGAAPARVPACVGGCANGYFNVLRIVEDAYWQAGLRGSLQAYVAQVDGEGATTLAVDLDFYTRYSLKVLSSRSRDVSAAFGGLPWNVTQVYYPWNRTFEIGLTAAAMASAPGQLAGDPELSEAR